jgi:hypothetical protein
MGAQLTRKRLPGVAMTIQSPTDCRQLRLRHSKAMAGQVKTPTDCRQLKEHQIVITRFGAPNIYDQYPLGTLCNSQDGSIYKQISRDENSPVWDRLTDDDTTQQGVEAL